MTRIFPVPLEDKHFRSTADGVRKFFAPDSQGTSSGPDDGFKC
ncbi:MAG TPA: hypothetical protein VGK59_02145 [Ohtaekwangia sp.]